MMDFVLNIRSNGPGLEDFWETDSKTQPDNQLARGDLIQNHLGPGGGAPDGGCGERSHPWTGGFRWAELLNTQKFLNSSKSQKFSWMRVMN